MMLAASALMRLGSWLDSRTLPRRKHIGFAALVALGFAAHASAYFAPLGSERWLRGPLYEDAYYFLSIARNVDTGLGLTYSGLQTNGFQPLHLAVCWLVGRAMDWHPHATPAAVSLLGVAVFSLLGPVLLRMVLERNADMGKAAWWIAPLAWFSNPTAARTAANGMESPWVAVAWIWFLLALLDWRARPESVWRGVALGLSLGFGFLTRNDFVVAGVATLWVVAHVAKDVHSPRRFAGALPALGAAAAVTAALSVPWVTFSWLRFGSIIPQSGLAEGIGSLVDRGRVVQLEYLAMGLARNLVPLPLPLSHLPPVPAALVATAVSAGAFWLLARALRGTDFERLLPLLFSLALLTLIYGLRFGAPHCTTRWLLPWFCFSAVAVSLLLEAVRPRRSLASGAVALVLVCAGSSRVAVDAVRSREAAWEMTPSYPIFKLIQRLDPRLSVGALQSGLPHWMDPRVQNLDGKVNREVLAAILAGQFGPWLAGSGPDVVVDTWLFGYDKHPSVRAVYDSHHLDGLMVLSRKGLATPWIALPGGAQP